MKVGDLVELSRYGYLLNARWRERGLVGIVTEEHAPQYNGGVYSVQWSGLAQPPRHRSWRYDRRELKFVKR